ncbi:MAG: tetratricopeptide repeat protein [Gemmataceae bacterium]|nr:tetratricopeptide repeat protein [Gemmataceae bacterium]
MRDCNETFRLQPNNVLAWETRSCAHFHLGQPDQAIADAEKVLSLNPKNWMAFQIRGRARVAKNEMKAAMADLTQAIELNPRDNVSLRERGIAYFYQRNYKPAADDLTAAIDIHQAAFSSPDAESHYYRGRIQTISKNYDAAIIDLTVAIRAVPGFAKAYYQRSIAYTAKGDRVKAKSDYARAIKLDPNVAKE